MDIVFDSYSMSFEYNISKLKSLMNDYDYAETRHWWTLRYRTGNYFGEQAFKLLSERRHKALPCAEFELGDELFIEDRIDNIFKERASNDSSHTAAGVVVACYNPKRGNSAQPLYFDYLDYTQPEFDTSSFPNKYSGIHLAYKMTGNIICAKTKKYHQVYDIVHECKTENEIWEAIRGKCLKVVDIIETIAGGHVLSKKHNFLMVYDYPSIRKIPVFDFVDKNTIFWPDYDSRYFYNDYKIVCDKTTNKWGIINARSNRTIVECVFDDIEWGIQKWDIDLNRHLKKGVLSRKYDFVTFSWNKKKAIYWIDDLDNTPIQFKHGIKDDICERFRNDLQIGNH